MVELDQRDSERLYLQKDGTRDIFIENSQILSQHQIDGLRFLYIQFRKKKPGVIINFPPKCGKTVAVALFIYAVRDLLKKPVLIVCADDHEICLWREYFLMWTEYNDDDIIIESPKILKDKKVFITKAEGLISYSMHSWSIVVVKENNTLHPYIFRISDAEYKILISSTDVKKDIPMLDFVYNWLCPKEKIDFEQFTTICKNQGDIYSKSVHFDSILENFVIREDNIKTFNAKNSASSNTDTNINISRKSRKNKDATGTKIKRTKKTTDNIISPNNEIPSNNIPIDNSISHKENVNKIIDDKSQIKNESTNILETASNVMEVDTESLNFASAIEDIVKNENNIKTENSTESMDFDDDTKTVVKEISVYEVNDSKKDVTDNINKTNDVVSDERMELTENADNSLKRHNIDSKLTELEVSTLKKFKGSFLDSLF